MTDKVEKLLDLQKVGKQFGATIALKDVDFDLFAGEVHGLVGENGAGKSTLMKILSGVHQEYEGSIIARGQPFHFSSTKEALKQGIGMIYQELSVIKTLSVAENLFLGDPPVSKLGIVDWNRMYREAKQHMTQLGINLDVRTPVGNYTVATQQMIEIASVIFSGAKIIIMDEPTSALSHNEVKHLFDFIRLLKRQGKGIVFISHFLDEVLEISDRITVLRNGCKVLTANAKDMNKEQVTTAILGKTETAVNNTRRAGAQLPVGNKILELQNIQFGKRLHDIQFSLHSGEILGIFGGMGAGKSELASLLFGINHPDEGEIIIDGKKVNFKTTTDAKRMGIAYVPANRRDTIFPGVEIYKNISVSHLPDICPGLVNRNVEVAKSREMIRSLGVRPPDPFRTISALSGGNQQKAVLGKWLTTLPKVLILNDPTRGMDVGAKQEVMQIVTSLKTKNVATLLLSSEPELMMNYADRVIVLHRGEQMAEIPQEDITKELLMSYL